MSKPSIPSRAPRNAPQPKVHHYIGALVADDFGGMRKLTLATANSFAKKKLDAASQSLQLRSERQAKKARGVEARASVAAERGLQAELRESDRRISLFWRRMLTKIRPERTVTHTPPRARTRAWPYASVALPKYDNPVIDRRGHRSVFVRFRYYSRRTAKAGVSQRVLLYCYNGAELDAAGNPYVHSNVGETIDEALCGFDHLEQVNWAAQAGAKLLMHGILAVDNRQTPDEMMRVGVRWAEEALGRFDLPYLVALHAPPEDGDPRNWHIHITWSFRPMIRTGDHEWEVAEMLRTDLDNPAAMKLMREMYASVMTEMSFEAGQNQVWTAKSNADRGLVHEPQIHLGTAQTNRARQGEHVPANEENHERVMRSKAAVLDDELRHADEVLAKQQESARAIIGRWARPLVMPIRLPQLIVAAKLSGSLPTVAQPVARVTGVIVPPLDVPTRIEPARPTEKFGYLSFDGLQRATAIDWLSISGKRLPMPPRPAQPAKLEIANLRFQAIERSQASIAVPVAVPAGRRFVPSPVTFAALTEILPPRIYDNDVPKPVTLRLRSQVTVPSVQPIVTSAMPRAASPVPIIAFPPRVAVPAAMKTIGPIAMPPPVADTGFIRMVIGRVADALREDDERRARADNERVWLANMEREASHEQRRHSLARLFEAIAEERHYLERVDGRHVVDLSLLERFGVGPADLMTADAQKHMAEITSRQADEVNAISDHVARRPDQIVKDGDQWVLDVAAPADVRALVQAWRVSPHMQRALERVVAKRPIRPTVTAGVPVEPGKRPGTAWRNARQMREQAMARGDRTERYDRGVMECPGSRIDRPGTEYDVLPRTPARRRPGIPGLGVGD